MIRTIVDQPNLLLYIYRETYEMKVRDIIKNLQDEGWYLATQSGSHKIFKHSHNPNVRIVLPDHGNNKEPSIGVLNDIKKKADNNKLILNNAIFSTF